jgi:hypothetical protein
MVNPNQGTIGAPLNNVTGLGTVNIVPQSQIVLRTTDREIGNATLRYALNRTARGPGSLVGGNLVTGSVGMPVSTAS